MTRRSAACCLAALTIAMTGCGGGGGSKPTTAPRQSTTTSSTTATRDLEEAVRTAIRLNARLSNYVLWHNVLPRWARQSTGGPALAALEAAAAERRKQHVQLRGISPRFDIVDMRLDASYAEALAIVRETGRIHTYRRGHPSGRAVKVDARVRLRLRRMTRAPRFVVWEVAPDR
jgi:hypothetical protein